MLTFACYVFNICNIYIIQNNVLLFQILSQFMSTKDYWIVFSKSIQNYSIYGRVSLSSKLIFFKLWYPRANFVIISIESAVNDAKKEIVVCKSQRLKPGRIST